MRASCLKRLASVFVPVDAPAAAVGGAGDAAWRRSNAMRLPLSGLPLLGLALALQQGRTMRTVTRREGQLGSERGPHSLEASRTVYGSHGWLAARDVVRGSRRRSNCCRVCPGLSCAVNVGVAVCSGVLVHAAATAGRLAGSRCTLTADGACRVAS